MCIHVQRPTCRSCSTWPATLRLRTVPQSSNCCSVSAADSVALIRERADTFISYATDPDPSCMRRAAIEGLGLFLDDIDKVMGILRKGP